MQPGRLPMAPHDDIKPSKLRRNFFKLISFETIFYPALALHCGMCRAPALQPKKQNAALQVAFANPVMTCPQSR
jgi:hypothetical protein